MKRIFFYSTLLASVFVSSPAQPYDSIIAFGDSLTDTHNSPASPLMYYQGRRSNGPLWIEYLSASFGLEYNPENNFAVAGATTEDVIRQAEDYVPEGDISNSLFAIWAAANDFTALLASGPVDESWDAAIDRAVANLRRAVEIIAENGARTIVLPNTADYSRIPGAAILPPSFIAFVREKIDVFNARLATVLSEVRSSRPEVNLLIVDFFDLYNRIYQNPQAFGFTNVTSAALFDPALTDKSFDGPGKDYLFWGLLYPTTKAHALLADSVFDVVAHPVGLSLAVSKNEVRVQMENLKIGRAYRLEQTADLRQWTTVDDFSAEATGREWEGSASRTSKAFFRVRWER